MRKYQIQKLEEIVQVLKNKNKLIDRKCEIVKDLNLDLDENIDEYLKQFENVNCQSEEEQTKTSSLIKSQNDIYLDDKDIKEMLDCLDESGSEFSGKLRIVKQNITNESIIKLCDVLSKQNKAINNIEITHLDLSKNKNLNKYSGIYIGNMLLENKTIDTLILEENNLETEGINRIIESVAFNEKLRNINLGYISNDSLFQLSQFLLVPHHIKYLAFQQDKDVKFSEENKALLINALNSNIINQQILSIDFITHDHLQENWEFINELNIICKRNRKLLQIKESQKLGAIQLDSNHQNYYDPFNHKENQLKFSCKQYISNVFEDFLDQGLYLLEKERMNMIRDEKIRNITGEEQVQKFKENLRSADGSIIFLARYLISKLDKKYQ